MQHKIMCVIEAFGQLCVIEAFCGSLFEYTFKFEMRRTVLGGFAV